MLICKMLKYSSKFKISITTLNHYTTVLLSVNGTDVINQILVSQKSETNSNKLICRTRLRLTFYPLCFTLSPILTCSQYWICWITLLNWAVSFLKAMISPRAHFCHALINTEVQCFKTWKLNELCKPTSTNTATISAQKQISSDIRCRHTADITLHFIHNKSSNLNNKSWVNLPKSICTTFKNESGYSITDNGQSLLNVPSFCSKLY